MENLRKVPKSLPSFRRSSPISPSSIRMLRQVVETRDTSKFINLSSTLRNLKHNPNGETFELSFQLSTLRRTLDKYSVLNFQKESRVRELKMKLKELKDSFAIKPEDVQRQKFYKGIKAKVKEILQKEEQELEHQTTLEWMCERMESTKEFLEKRESKLKKRMEKQNLELEQATRFRKDVVDSVYQFKTVHGQALKQFLNERQALADEVSRLENQSMMKKKLIEKTEEHNRHRLEIVEQTMIDESSGQLEEMRNAHLLHKAINFFFNRKIMSAKNEFSRLDDAFQKIRFRTGIHSAEEMIERFLTQEENYNEITENIHKKESEFVEYKEKIEEIQLKVKIIKSEKALKSFENENFVKANEEVLKLKRKQSELEKIVNKIDTWLEITAQKMFGTSGGGWKELKITEKFRLFREKLKIVMKEYLRHGVSEENEKKRKKMRLDDIINVTTVAAKSRNSILEKPIALKSFNSRKIV